jgi:purine-nucleoside/S-methyl-5'-thioadenosine phosphorylase / adenosine deaminase
VVRGSPEVAEVLTSPALARAGFAHGFATRRGGVSRGAFASLSFARGREPKEAVDENLGRLGRAVGFAPDALFEVSQVHGARVVREQRGVEADAIVVGTGAAGVRVADCVPVLVGHVESGAAAAVHAGWRGVVAGVVGAALAELGVGRKVAAVGPSIGPCCFEVGAEVALEIARAAQDPGVVARRVGTKAYVDLRRAVRAQLRAAGIADVEIEDVPGCTRCDAERFFSFRRDGDPSGRHLAVIVARGR